MAPPEEIAALIVGFDWGRKAVRNNYDGDPLTLAAAQKDPAQAREWLENAGFAEWVLKRTGPTNLLGWCAANDPAASMAALKTSGKWPDLLGRLRRDAGPAGAARPQCSRCSRRPRTPATGGRCTRSGSAGGPRERSTGSPTARPSGRARRASPAAARPPRR